jgi:hypothetical protein
MTSEKCDCPAGPLWHMHFRTEGSPVGVACPFCGEHWFRLASLKYHLEGFCERYDGLVGADE